MEHVDFIMKLADGLMATWDKRRGDLSIFNRRPNVHQLGKIKHHGVCREFHSKKFSKLVCTQCGVFLHMGVCFPIYQFPISLNFSTNKGFDF